MGGMNSEPSWEKGIDRDHHQDHRHGDGQLGKPQHPFQKRVIDGLGHPVDGVFGFRRDFTPEEGQHHDGHQGDGQHGRRAHGKGLGVGQGLEETAALGAQGEDGQEGDGDHQEGEEQRGPHFLGGLQDQGAPGRVRGGVLDVLVGVFDHDHRGVHHDPDGEGDAAQAHDVGADARGVHDGQGDQDPQGQGDDGHQGTAEVQQEDDADQGHDHHFFDELVGQVGNGPVDQVGTVIGRGDDHPRGQTGLELG